MVAIFILVVLMSCIVIRYRMDCKKDAELATT